MAINLLGPINSLGYGVACHGILRGLLEVGQGVALFPIGYPVDGFNTGDPAIIECLNRQDVYYANSPSLMVWHQNNLALRVGGGLHAGFPIFELDGFTKREAYHMEMLDRLLVCSKWAADVVEEALGIGCTVCNLGVDRSIFFDAPTYSQHKKIIFLNIGKWEIRKGHDVLIDAWKAAFNGSNDVQLWMMNHNPFLSESQEKEWLDLYREPNIKILPRVNTHKEVADIMRSAHVGVFPSRAEGWNLEALEMLSCGRQLIITDYSAHTEFCTDKNSLLIPVDSLEEAFDGQWFHGGVGNWAKLGQTQFDCLVDQLRYAVTVADVMNEAGVETAKRLSWANTGRQVCAALDIGG